MLEISKISIGKYRRLSCAFWVWTWIPGRASHGTCVGDPKQKLTYFNHKMCCLYIYILSMCCLAYNYYGLVPSQVLVLQQHPLCFGILCKVLVVEKPGPKLKNKTKHVGSTTPELADSMYPPSKVPPFQL